MTPYGVGAAVFCLATPERMRRCFQLPSPAGNLSQATVEFASKHRGVFCEAKYGWGEHHTAKQGVERLNGDLLIRKPMFAKGKLAKFALRTLFSAGEAYSFPRFARINNLCIAKAFYPHRHSRWFYVYKWRNPQTDVKSADFNIIGLKILFFSKTKVQNQTVAFVLRWMTQPLKKCLAVEKCFVIIS